MLRSIRCWGAIFLLDTGNGAYVAILSYGIWQTQMGGDREAIGRAVALNGEPFTVIGVMPPVEGSVDPVLPGETDLWTPLTLVGQTAGSGREYEVLQAGSGQDYRWHKRERRCGALPVHSARHFLTSWPYNYA